jgi:hypothetical protein|tara:strand:+ start:619 stop:1452 length:834 start_codon:yes stop_codon:yes gene_type:complete
MKIAIIVNHGLDILKDSTEEEKIASVVECTERIKLRIFKQLDCDYDVHLRLNYTGELTKYKLDQIAEISTYPNIKSISIVNKAYVVDELSKFVKIPGGLSDIVSDQRFQAHMIQHFVFFNTAINLLHADYDYYYRLRPDTIMSKNFNIQRVINEFPRGHLGDDNIFITPDMHKVPSKIRPLNIFDQSFICDNEFIKQTKINFTEWLTKGLDQVIQCRLSSLTETEMLYVIAETFLGDLLLINGSGCQQPRDYECIIHRFFIRNSTISETLNLNENFN